MIKSNIYTLFKDKYPSFQSKAVNFLLFMLIGLPTFIIALLLNFTLVQYLNWPKPIAYALVLIIQVSINYFMCKYFVFKNETKTSLLVQYIQFMSGIMTIRFFDWLLYSILTQALPVHFIIIQISNVIIFSLLKYRFAKSVIEGV